MLIGTSLLALAKTAYLLVLSGLCMCAALTARNLIGLNARDTLFNSHDIFLFLFMGS